MKRIQGKKLRKNQGLEIVHFVVEVLLLCTSFLSVYR
jgi:hypothetical protein